MRDFLNASCLFDGENFEGKYPLRIDKRMYEEYNNKEIKSCLQGGVKVPTGGNADYSDEPASIEQDSGAIPEPTVQSG